jgi:hypothetical protein
VQTIALQSLFYQLVYNTDLALQAAGALSDLLELCYLNLILNK